MFCPKCGAYNEDSSAFCCKCGARLANPDAATTSPATPAAPPPQQSYGAYPQQQNYGGYQQPMYGGYPQQQYNPVNTDFIQGAPEEREKKKAVLICFFVVNGMIILFILAVLISQFKFLADLMEFNYWSKEAFAEAMNRDASSWGFLILIAWIGYDAFNFVLLRKHCIRRDFSKSPNWVIKGDAVIDGFFILGSVFVFPIIGSSRGVSPSVLCYFVAGILVAGKVVYTVLFCKAADAERYYKLMEKQAVDNAEWTCPKCGTVNSGKDIFCSKCEENKPRNVKPVHTLMRVAAGGNNSGQYRTDNRTSRDKDVGQGSNAVWICPSCGEPNPKNSPVCKGCGKYK